MRHISLYVRYTNLNMSSYARRRAIAILIILLISAYPLSQTTMQLPTLDQIVQTRNSTNTSDEPLLSNIEVKGRAPKTGYERAAFGNGWDEVDGCSVRNTILQRDLTGIRMVDACVVESGLLQDPYTGSEIQFNRGADTSDDVQIDHVVALSNAWQTGAQQLSYENRIRFANDPLNLLAVSGQANQQKSDSDAATWLPSNKTFRCTYVTRQAAVKNKYDLWMTEAEFQAVERILQTCDR
jgi:hypothetical protein